MKVVASLAALLALLVGESALAQQRDPANPTCPPSPNWSTNPEMRFTPQTINGHRILLAEGAIDDNLIPRLTAALRDDSIEEIWLRSPGGNARVGNEAGVIIRQSGLPTRIPAGWACFSACNFLFMGGSVRYVDPGGLFIVHMFTHTADREAIQSEVARGTDNTVGLIRDVEQDSVQLASEDNAFLLRMGISRRLLTEVMYQVPANHYRCLTQAEVNTYNVATVPWTGPTPGPSAPQQQSGK